MSRWPEAPRISGGAAATAPITGLLDLSILQTDKYEEALRQGDHAGCGRASDPKGILDDVAAQWDAVTEKIGVDKQRAGLSEWANKPDAYPND